MSDPLHTRAFMFINIIAGKHDCNHNQYCMFLYGLSSDSLFLLYGARMAAGTGAPFVLPSL